MTKEKLFQIQAAIDVQQVTLASDFENGDVSKPDFESRRQSLDNEMTLVSNAILGWKHFSPEPKDQGRPNAAKLGVRSENGFRDLLKRVQSELGHYAPDA